MSTTSSNASEGRRRQYRLIMTRPMRGHVGTTRIFIADMSSSGLRIVHEDRVPRVGEIFQLIVEINSEGIALQCEVRRTQVRESSGPDRRKVFESGVRVVPSEYRSVTSLIELMRIEGQKR